jgi:hypothetical protein
MDGKVVKIVGSSSIPAMFLGMYGVITGKAYADKWTVELYTGAGKKGSLSHTADKEDFEVVGEVYKR